MIAVKVGVIERFGLEGTLKKVGIIQQLLKGEKNPTEMEQVKCTREVLKYSKKSCNYIVPLLKERVIIFYNDPERQNCSESNNFIQYLRTSNTYHSS